MGARTSTAAAVKALRDYYDPAGGYAGTTFLDLPNDPGDITATSRRHHGDITATDLYALSTLDVRATPRAGRRLLCRGSCRTAVLDALASPVSADIDLRTAGSDTWTAAAKLYEASKPALGRNPWVTTSRLCARKRPNFFPVRDRVVSERLLGLGRSYLVDWGVYRHLLRNRRCRATSGRQRLLRPSRWEPRSPTRPFEPLTWSCGQRPLPGCGNDATDGPGGGESRVTPMAQSPTTRPPR